MKTMCFCSDEIGQTGGKNTVGNTLDRDHDL